MFSAVLAPRSAFAASVVGALEKAGGVLVSGSVFSVAVRSGCGVVVCVGGSSCVGIWDAGGRTSHLAAFFACRLRHGLD